MSGALAEGRDTQVRIGLVRIEATSPLAARRLADALGPAIERRLAAPSGSLARTADPAERAAAQIVAAIERAAEPGR